MVTGALTTDILATDVLATDILATDFALWNVVLTTFVKHSGWLNFLLAEKQQIYRTDRMMDGWTDGWMDGLVNFLRRFYKDLISSNWYLGHFSTACLLAGAGWVTMADVEMLDGVRHIGHLGSRDVLGVLTILRPYIGGVHTSNPIKSKWIHARKGLFWTSKVKKTFHFVCENIKSLRLIL